MPFPTTGVLDSFNRSNTGPPPSASWSQAFGGIFGQFKVVSNRAAVNSILNGYAENYYNVAAYGGDCEAYVTIVTKPANATFFGIAFRLVDLVANPEGYLLVLNAASGTDTLQIDRIDNGARTIIGAAVSQEVSNGDAIGIRAIGSTLTCWYKASGGSWTPLFSRTDSAYSAAGRIELITTSAATVLDDFGGGTYVPIAVTGGAVSIAAGSGASTYTPAPSGTTYTLAGGSVSAAAGSGSAAEVLTLAGSGVSPLAGSGAGTRDFALTGAAVSTLAGSGPVAEIYAITGVAVSTPTASGLSEYITPGGTTYALTGGAVSAVTGSGEGGQGYSVLGVAASTLSSSAAAAMIFDMSGAGMGISRGSGAPAVAFALTGGAEALFAGLGSVMVVWPASGGATSEFWGAGAPEYFNGSVITPPERICNVTAEIRALILSIETRALTINAENRRVAVLSELRQTVVDAESRVVYAG